MALSNASLSKILEDSPIKGDLIQGLYAAGLRTATDLLSCSVTELRNMLPSASEKEAELIIQYVSGVVFPVAAVPVSAMIDPRRVAARHTTTTRTTASKVTSAAAPPATTTTTTTSSTTTTATAATMTASNLYKRPRRGGLLSFGCPDMDELVGGGLRPGQLTEIAGESAAGKTQIALQLLVNAQLPDTTKRVLDEDGEGVPSSAATSTTAVAEGAAALREEHGQSGAGSLGTTPAQWEPSGLGCPSVYIATEDVFPHRRLHEIMTQFVREHPDAGTVEEVGSRIFVENARSEAELWAILTKKLPKMMARFGVRLVVIDSIAGVFRNDFDNTASSAWVRSDCFFRHAAQLQSLADTHSAVVVIINQVSDCMELELPTSTGAVASLPPDGYGSDHYPFSPHQTTDMCSVLSSGRKVKPALGMAWNQCVNVRLMLSRDQSPLASLFADSDSCRSGVSALSSASRATTTTGGGSTGSNSTRGGSSSGNSGPTGPTPTEDLQSDSACPVRRFLHVIYSPCAAPCSLPVRVTSAGVRAD